MCESEKGSILKNDATDELVKYLGMVSLEERDIRQLSSKDQTLLQQLKTLECPFTWAVSFTVQHEHKYIITKVQEKSEEIEDEETSFCWHSFILNLVLCYEYCQTGCISESFSKLMECEEILNTGYKHEDNVARVTPISLEGLWHVCLACKCFLQLKSGLQADETLARIQLLSQMSEPQQASVWGCYASFCMEYGCNGTREALALAEKAIQLDPQQGEWHFLQGKAMSRIRHTDDYSVIPDKKELKALEKAVELTNNPYYMIFLAQAYRETSFRVFNIHRNNMDKYKSICTSMNDRAVELYRKGLALKKNCSRINIRCAQGFMKFGWEHRDLTQAKECIDRALNLAPNNAMVHHVAGLYFHRYGNDMERAKQHFTIGGENGAFGAWMDLFKLKYEEKSNYDPIPDFEKLLTQYKETQLQYEILSQMGSYNFFIKNDLKTALDHWKRVLKEDPESVKITKHKCMFIHMEFPVNIHEILFDEARLILKNNLGTPEDRKMWRKIIFDYTNSHPEFSERSPKSHRKMILDESTRKQSGSRFQSGYGRGRGSGRGWGSGRGSGRGSSTFRY